MKHVKNTSTRPVTLTSGSTLAPGELGHTHPDDPSLTAGLLTLAVTAPPPPKVAKSEKKEIEE